VSFAAITLRTAAQRVFVVVVVVVIIIIIIIIITLSTLSGKFWIQPRMQ
jgi:hypothetical protein